MLDGCPMLRTVEAFFFYALRCAQALSKGLSLIHPSIYPGSSHMSSQSRCSGRRCWPSIVEGVAHFGSKLPHDLMCHGSAGIAYLGTLTTSCRPTPQSQPLITKYGVRVATIFVSIVECTGHFVGPQRPTNGHKRDTSSFRLLLFQ
jgi:hypothetical protein